MQQAINDPSPATRQRNKQRDQEIPSSSIPVIISDQAQVIIEKSKPQGRRLPAALAWKFDTLADVIKEIRIETVNSGENLLITILHKNSAKNYQHAIKASELFSDTCEALGIASLIKGLYQESRGKAQKHAVHDGLIFCDRSGKLDLCDCPPGCKRAQVIVCDAKGNYIPAPGRTRLPFFEKLTKQHLRLPVCSDGKGGVCVGHATGSMYAMDIKELGFILTIDAKKSEVEIFTSDGQGYF